MKPANHWVQKRQFANTTNSNYSKLESFYKENKEFYKYYRTDNTSLDNNYFLRGKHDLKNTLDSFHFQADNRFTTSYDYKVAKIIANEKLKNYIEKEINSLKYKEKVPTNSHKTQNWTGSKVGLIELNLCVTHRRRAK